MTLDCVKPLKDKLIVKLLPLYSGSVTKGLTLVRHGRHHEFKTRHAKVIVTGPKVLEVKRGDTVVILGHAGKWVNDPEADCAQDEGLYRSLTEDEVLAVESN